MHIITFPDYTRNLQLLDQSETSLLVKVSRLLYFNMGMKHWPMDATVEINFPFMLSESNKDKGKNHNKLLCFWNATSDVWSCAEDTTKRSRWNCGMRPADGGHGGGRVVKKMRPVLNGHYCQYCSHNTHPQKKWRENCADMSVPRHIQQHPCDLEGS